jgi:hypothetical protein
MIALVSLPLHRTPAAHHDTSTHVKVIADQVLGAQS